MVRTLLLLVLFIVFSTSAFAVGMVPQGDARGTTGVQSSVGVMLTGENATKSYEFTATASSPVVTFDGSSSFSKSLTLSPFEKEAVIIRLTASAPGTYTITYSLRETTPGMFQSNLQDSFEFKVTGSAPSNNTGTGSSTSAGGGGGGGGGGGYIPPKTNYSAPASVVDAVNRGEIPPEPSPEERAMIEAELNRNNALAPQNNVGPLQGVQNIAEAAVKVAMTPEARRWGLIAMGIGLVMLVLQVSVISLVKKEEA